MVSIEEAQRIILEQIATVRTETVPLLEGLYRIAAEDRMAPWDLPAADNSAMDGFTFSHAALAGNRLRVTGFLPAGAVRTTPVPPGEAIKIMTGAPLPPGCDTIVPIEDVAEEGEWIRLAGTIKAGSHVRKRGEDIGRGDIVISAGALLRPQEIGMLAAMGSTTVSVHRRPRVAILATGDELQEPGTTLAPGKIINSNSYGLAAQVLAAGGDPILLGIAADNQEVTSAKITSGLSADLLVISGGVSVGDRDFVKAAIEQLGGEVVFWKVNMKPGKPLAFALLQGKPIAALPGNPVAAMVSFELFLRPAILAAAGHRRVFRTSVRALLREAIANKGKRPHLARGIVTIDNDRYYATTTGNQSSGRLSSLTRGNALLYLDTEREYVAGDAVDAILLDQEFEMLAVKSSHDG